MRWVTAQLDRISRKIRKILSGISMTPGQSQVKMTERNIGLYARDERKFLAVVEIIEIYDPTLI